MNECMDAAMRLPILVSLWAGAVIAIGVAITICGALAEISVRDIRRWLTQRRINQRE